MRWFFLLLLCGCSRTEGESSIDPPPQPINAEIGCQVGNHTDSNVMVTTYLVIGDTGYFQEFKRFSPAAGFSGWTTWIHANEPGEWISFKVDVGTASGWIGRIDPYADADNRIYQIEITCDKIVGSFPLNPNGKVTTKGYADGIKVCN